MEEDASNFAQGCDLRLLPGQHLSPGFDRQVDSPVLVVNLSQVGSDLL